MSVESPRLLILETSGRFGHVAVARGETLLARSRLDEARRQARDLAPAVSELLRSQGWKARDLQGVIVSLGPGSYTGLRVGIISAKALCYAIGCPLVGVETFAAIAAQAPAQAARLDVLTDAQQDKVYVQPFARSADGAWRSTAPLSIRTVDDWLAGRDAEAWVSGPGIDAHTQRLPAAVSLVPLELRIPQPESLLRLGLERYVAGERDDVWTLEPIYLRPSSAEEQWQRLGRG
ncbi:MAG: tRNA (adenosine(37)-N6)-threonylcarbamoyltransferase complex dimerization subunit type 1 TsaB [Planctomycetes bacterium]|nr:tRNA (adenosine(37)-N6)-threonylcarbamoyltransferase complex dimerization subunit type 1 TsaB [Planctomycetota bacterium]